VRAQEGDHRPAGPACVAKPHAVRSAIEALSAGIGFADALHLAASQQADEGFAIFIQRARKRWPGIAIRAS
jgi:hypothetical protein